MMDNFQFGINLNHYKGTEEISISHELKEFIAGEDFGEQKFCPFVHRKMRVDKYDKKTRCVCWRELENEGVEGCPYCDGIGFYWDEFVIPGFDFLLSRKSVTGLMGYEIEISRDQAYVSLLITPPEVEIATGDRVLLPHVNNRGLILHPVKMKKEYIIIEEIERRLDWGTKEFSWSVLKRVS